MDKLSILLKGALGLKVPTEFATEDYDYNKALFDELKKIAPDRKAFRRVSLDIYDLLAENLDEILPNKIIEAVGVFAEVMKLPQGTRPEFRVRKGKQRAKQFVTRATESGVYETFRLDRDRFDVYPHTYAGAQIIDFERYLDGIEDLADGYEVITEGFSDVVYREIQNLLLASWNDAGRPAANKFVASSFDIQGMRELCNTVAAYGDPIIYCTPQFASTMVNAIVYSQKVKIAEQDLLDIRNRGYIGVFFGTPVVVIPNSFDDETNTKLSINPCFAYVIPAGKEKIVKVIYEGEAYFKEVTNQDNSLELQAYVKMGFAVVATPNFWGIYFNTGISDGGWEDYNFALTGLEPGEDGSETTGD